MTDINDIDEEVLIKSIREIISSADLNVMTAKLVRNELKTKLNVENLDSRKKQINLMIDDVIRDLSKAKDKKQKDNDEDRNGSKTKPQNKNKESDTSDSSSDEDGIDDESLARKLHNEELDSKRRSAKKVVKSKTSKKKGKNDTDNSEPKSKKPSKNGYTKPCTLSAELAEFVGQDEMPRHEVVKHMWAYVRDNNLFDPKNKQFAICDEGMTKILGRKRVRMFGVMKHLSKHFIK